MKIKDFKKALETEEPNTLIKKHMQGDLYLTDKQLEKVIKLNNNKPVGCNNKWSLKGENERC